MDIIIKKWHGVCINKACGLLPIVCDTKSWGSMYTFKLQAVLDHRQFFEDNLRKELSEIKAKVVNEEQLLESLKRKEMKTIQSLQVEQVSGITCHQIVTYHTYLNQLFKRISAQETVVEGIRTEAAQKHAEMIDAVKKRKILESLKEKGIDRYRQMILDQDAKIVDEIAVNQFIRKSIEPRGDNE